MKEIPFEAKIDTAKIIGELEKANYLLEELDGIGFFLT